MTVREYIAEMQKLDQDKNIWLMYDPPFSVSEPEITHLIGENLDYADMFEDRGVKEGDYALIVY
jgi:hypothetical protein